jgi:hypothetical protein
VGGEVFDAFYLSWGPEKCVWRYISGAESPYNGADLIVKSNHGLIVVTIQYRLGLFGFLAGEAVKCGGAPNAGLREFLWVTKRQCGEIALQSIRTTLCSGCNCMSVLALSVRLGF